VDIYGHLSCAHLASDEVLPDRVNIETHALVLSHLFDEIAVGPVETLD